MTQTLVDADDSARLGPQWLVERPLEVFRIVLIGVLIVVGIVAAIVHAIRWTAAQERHGNHLPPIFLAFDDPDQAPLAARRSDVDTSGKPSSADPRRPAAYGPLPTSSSSFAPRSPASSTPQIGIAVPSVGAAGAAASAALAPTQSPVIHLPAPPLAWPTHLRVVRDDPEPEPSMLQGELTPDETVRFRPPSDEPVQLLPGRLEVLSGEPNHRDIRFVRVPGRPAELIIGRQPGDSPPHVRLRSRTVSRQHAHLAFLDGEWTVMNLSRTNPIAINGTELSSSGASYGLSDGDRLALGEVVLRFHTH